MNIHFTWGATDPVDSFGAMVVPLLEGAGKTHVLCLHLSPGTETRERPVTRGLALLVVHGKVTVRRRREPRTIEGAPITLLAGVGDVLQIGQFYRIHTEQGAIVLAVECDQLKPTAEGISHPQRIAGQQWTGRHVGATESY
jgi:hypothetical protein